jgi:hypothetical protein
LILCIKIIFCDLEWPFEPYFMLWKMLSLYKLYKFLQKNLIKITVSRSFWLGTYSGNNDHCCMYITKNIYNYFPEFIIMKMHIRHEMSYEIKGHWRSQKSLFHYIFKAFDLCSNCYNCYPWTSNNLGFCDAELSSIQL